MTYELIFSHDIVKDITTVKNQKGEHIGVVVQRRVGRRNRWVLEPVGETYWTGGCLEQVGRWIARLEEVSP